MEKYAWVAKIKNGKKDEYILRHKNIWDSMKQVLTEAGIKNYSIWLYGNQLFGYYECEKGVDFACKVQSDSKVVKEWNEYMKDVMVMPLDKETGAQPKLIKVFDFR